MKIDVPAGRYIVAVSGGVDSMVLLDLLSKADSLELIVAHFNHGIRTDAQKDEQLVEKVVLKLDLPLEIGRAKLGPSASEEQARKARYDFLRKVQKNYSTNKIITAHHLDDAIETAIINILRGTGRRGLSAIHANPNILRPLLNISKNEIKQYAQEHNIEWHEDTTNTDIAYLRNYVRLKVLPNLSRSDRNTLIEHLQQAKLNNKDIDSAIAKLSHKVIKGRTLYRQNFVLLPAEVGSEVIMYWLRSNGIKLFDRKTINRLNTLLRTAKNGTLCPVTGKAYIEFSAKTALLSYR